MNICQRFFDQAEKHPNKVALSIPKGKSGNYTYDDYTFEQLADRTKSLITSFRKKGIKKGTKVLVFVRPGQRFPAVTFALYAIGALPIFIDPGMGRKNLFEAVNEVKPDALIAEPEVHFLKIFFPGIFASIKISISTKNSWWNRLDSIDTLQTEVADDVQVERFTTDDLAAILFTSGGTGRPKGVEYTHGIFWNQVDLLQNMFGLTDRDVDLPGFPLFALFTLCMGMKVVVPDMNPSRPAQANPRHLIAHIKDQAVTFAAGSPAIWEKVAKYCVENDLTLPEIKFMVMFGAPVRNEIHECFAKVLPNGTTYTPYGATECLPISNISGREILAETAVITNQGKGTCVGKPCAENQLKIVAITDTPIAELASIGELESHQIGEIIVTGPTVTKAYYQDPEKTRESKIIDGQKVWHRMGDLGYLDEKGRLWFCGRKSHRVQVGERLLSTIPCEAIFNQHPAVKRTALIGPTINGKVSPSIVVEFNQQVPLANNWREEMKNLAQGHPEAQEVQYFYGHRNFPVDCRHNIKIDRLKLRDLAQQGKLQ